MSVSVFVEDCGKGLCSPFFDRDGFLQFLSQRSGDVLTVSETKTLVSVCNSGGQPSGAIIDSDGLLYIADLGHCAVVTVASDFVPQVAVRLYEDKQFKGPHSIACGPDGTMYFTDSGPIGETGLHSPTGSFFCIVASGTGQRLLKPLALECLAAPTGVAVSHDGLCVYVAERAANRVLRFVQSPPGTYQMTMFKQFSGGFGPTCVVCDRDGNIYVGRFELSSVGRTGKVTVLSSEGDVQSEISIPAPEITGLAISPDGRNLFVTEESTQTIFRVVL